MYEETGSKISGDGAARSTRRKQIGERLPNLVRVNTMESITKWCTKCVNKISAIEKKVDDSLGYIIMEFRIMWYILMQKFGSFLFYMF